MTDQERKDVRNFLILVVVLIAVGLIYAFDPIKEGDPKTAEAPAKESTVNFNLVTTEATAICRDREDLFPYRNYKRSAVPQLASKFDCRDLSENTPLVSLPNAAGGYREVALVVGNSVYDGWVFSNSIRYR